jgi:hypothetical protein
MFVKMGQNVSVSLYNILAKEQRNILHEISKQKANWMGHILHRNGLLQQGIEWKIKGGIEVTGIWGRSRKLLDDLKERRGYSHLKEEALDHNMWRAWFGRGFGPVVRQTTKWMNWFLHYGQVKSIDTWVINIYYYEVNFYFWVIKLLVYNASFSMVRLSNMAISCTSFPLCISFTHSVLSLLFSLQVFCLLAVRFNILWKYELLCTIFSIMKVFYFSVSF